MIPVGSARVSRRRRRGRVGDAIPDSVDSHFPIDEGSGSTIDDVVGDLTLDLNAPTWTSSPDAFGGYYLEFDGVDDRMSTTSNISQYQGIDELTVNLQFAGDDPDDYEFRDQIFGITSEDASTAGSSHDWSLDIGDESNVRVEINGTPYTSTDIEDLVTGDWVDVTFRIVSSEEASIFIDGDKKSSDSHSDDITSDGDYLLAMGAPDGSRRFIPGDIGRIDMFKKALSDDEISDYYG